MENEESDSNEKAMDSDEDIKYDVAIPSVEHPGDLKANSSGMMIWNVQNNGNQQWKDCDLNFMSGDALSVSIYHVRNLKPDEIGVISVVFDTFAVGGMYQS